MGNSHPAPAIYNPDIPYAEKCKIIREIAIKMAGNKGVSIETFRYELIEKVHVDVEHIHDPVCMLLLYEYLYAIRPRSCIDSENKNRH